MAAVHVIVDSQGFWERNSAEISFFTTATLVVLTGIYVLLTRSLAKADTDALYTAREANRLARESMDLATQERIDSATPNAAIYSMYATWEPQRGDVQVQPADDPPSREVTVDDPGTVLTLKLVSGFFANSRQPTVIDCEPPNFGEWSQPRHVLVPDNDVCRTQLVWGYTATAVDFLRLANERLRLTLTFTTRASGGGAVDRHRWTGVFTGIELKDDSYALRDRAFDRSEDAWDQERDYER